MNTPAGDGRFLTVILAQERPELDRRVDANTNIHRQDHQTRMRQRKALLINQIEMNPYQKF